MWRIKTLKDRVTTALHSRRGHNIGVFLIFLCVSTLLWGVLKLSDEEQLDIHLPVTISNMPDSVTLISNVPPAILANVRVNGLQSLKLTLGHVPDVDIDFSAHRSRNSIALSNAELKSAVRSACQGVTVNSVFPDSISIVYTTRQGILLPIEVDAQVTTGPCSSMVGQPQLSTDSAYVYVATNASAGRLGTLQTEHLHLDNVNSTVTRKLRLCGPAGSRIIPDSVEVTFVVEPLIAGQRDIVIEPVNVPHGIKLVTFPPKVEVQYLVPLSTYTNTNPNFRVVADFNEIISDSTISSIPLLVKDIPAGLTNVRAVPDSAQCIIERL